MAWEAANAHRAIPTPTEPSVELEVLNCVAKGIINDDIVRKAARQEIMRRYFRSHWKLTTGVGAEETMAVCMGRLVAHTPIKIIPPAMPKTPDSVAVARTTNGKRRRNALTASSFPDTTKSNSDLMEYNRFTDLPLRDLQLLNIEHPQKSTSSSADRNNSITFYYLT